MNDTQLTLFNKDNAHFSFWFKCIKIKSFDYTIPDIFILIFQIRKKFIRILQKAEVSGIKIAGCFRIIVR